MRDLKIESAIWSLFTSPEFFEAAARECDETMEWFGKLAVSREVASFGRNNQIFDTFKKLARDLRRGSELARLGDYKLISDAARGVSGDIRGMMEQPLHSWMTDAEYKEFSSVRIGRISAYTSQIKLALHNALFGAESYFNPNQNCPERSNDDDGFPGEEIVETFNAYVDWYEKPLFWSMPDPLPEYTVDTSVTCRTGDEVPWTGVWYPDTGLEKHSLTFAIKGLRMQPAYRVIKTTEELRTPEMMFPSPQTIAVPTTWHPVIASAPRPPMNDELRAKAGEPCPKSGLWEPTDLSKERRIYKAGEVMADLGSAYGFTVWRWVAEQ